MFLLWARFSFQKNIKVDESLSERFIKRIQNFYEPSLRYFLRHRIAVLVAAIFLLCSSIFLFLLWEENLFPNLMKEILLQTLLSGKEVAYLNQLLWPTQLENILMKNFPEVTETVSKIGSSEIPTDPMPIESGDLIILLKIKKNGRLLRIRKI